MSLFTRPSPKHMCFFITTVVIASLASHIYTFSYRWNRRYALLFCFLTYKRKQEKTHINCIGRLNIHAHNVTCEFSRTKMSVCIFRLRARACWLSFRQNIFFSLKTVVETKRQVGKTFTRAKILFQRFVVNY